jgi:hypothetical protein
VILILEDDGDREAYQQGPLVLLDHMRQGCCTVWISPEAYAKDVVLADLRARIEALRDRPGLRQDGLQIERQRALAEVLALLGEQP